MGMGVGFFYLLLAVAVGVLASSRGRNGLGWFLLSLLITPLLGFIFCLVSRNLAAVAQSSSEPSEATHRKCPKCAEFIKPEAVVCKHCGSEVSADPGFAERRVAALKAAKEEEDSNAFLGWGIIIGIGFVIYLFNR